MVRFSALGFCFVVAGWTTGCSNSCEDCSQEEASRLEPDTQAPGGSDASASTPPPNVPAVEDDETPASNEPAMPNETPDGTGGASGADNEPAPVDPDVGGSSSGAGLGGTASDGGASGSAGSGPTPLDAGSSETGETGGAGSVGASDAGTGTFACDPEAAEGDCEWCVQLRCCDERIACAENLDCAEQWPAFSACVSAADLATNPVADPISAVMDCLSEASPTGDALDSSDEMFDLVACIGTSVEESMDDLLEGDGQCTFACYGVDTLEPVDFDEGFDAP